MPDRPTWIALAVQLPAAPAYARVKLWRGLRAAGAVTLPGGLHLLPDTDAHRGAFAELAEEVIGRGGAATLLADAVWASGDDPVMLFRAERTRDYRQWCAETEAMLTGEVRAAHVGRMQRRLERLRAIDFFAAEDRAATEAAMRALLEASLRHPPVSRTAPGGAFRTRELQGRTWVTRRNVGVDRIASAWLIRRFIDARPRFRFVDAERYAHQRRELRFDMAEGEFTHEGDLCSFETLLARSGIAADAGLQAIARIVHQLDIEEGRDPDAAAARLAEELAALCQVHDKDEARITAAAPLFEALYEEASVDRHVRSRSGS